MRRLIHSFGGVPSDRAAHAPPWANASSRTSAPRSTPPLGATTTRPGHRRRPRRRGASRRPPRGRGDPRRRPHRSRCRTMARGRAAHRPGQRHVSGRARLRTAVWESGSGARLDGAAALIAAGMTGFETDIIDVTLPPSTRARHWPGVRRHQPRQTPAPVGAGVPRVPAPVATVNAAMWAASDRQAALLICLAVQQRIVPKRRLQTVASAAHGGRSAFVRQIVADVCDGAHSLGELDIGRLCTARGLPAPSRQQVRPLPSGIAYLDLTWEDAGLTMEIDGSHHHAGVMPVDDALRQNEVTITGDRVLRIPLLGLRLEPERFLDQIARGLVMQNARYIARSA